MSLELSFRSLLKGRQTSRWWLYTTWQYKIMGVNHKSTLHVLCISLSTLVEGRVSSQYLQLANANILWVFYKKLQKRKFCSLTPKVKRSTWISSIFVSAHYWRYYCSQISRQLSWISSGTYHLRSWVRKVGILISTGIALSGIYHRQNWRIEFFRSYW